MDTIKKYWHNWLWRDATNQIITINFVVWAALNILVLTHRNDADWWVGLFAVPGHIDMLPSRIWTVVTYMFSQYDFMHMLVNMMWLLLFGRLLSDQLSEQTVWRAYLICGLGGALAFILATLANHSNYPYMLGASCAVLGLIGMTMVMIPRVRVDLLFLGHVRVIWIAIAAIVLFVVIEPDIFVLLAHLGGLLIGVIGAAVKLYLRKQHAHVHPYTERQLDHILQKVGRSGYSSLSPIERQRLFDMSQHMKKK